MLLQLDRTGCIIARGGQVDLMKHRQPCLFICRLLPDRVGLPGIMAMPECEKQAQSSTVQGASVQTVAAGEYVHPVHGLGAHEMWSAARCCLCCSHYVQCNYLLPMAACSLLTL